MRWEAIKQANDTKKDQIFLLLPRVVQEEEMRTRRMLARSKMGESPLAYRPSRTSRLKLSQSKTLSVLKASQ